jgi:hypothetical protein
MKKLTLSAEEEVVRQAKRLARRRKTSVSAMFSRVIRGMSDRPSRGDAPPAGSIAGRARGFVALPAGKTARDVLADALIEKHGGKA